MSVCGRVCGVEAFLCVSLFVVKCVSVCFCDICVTNLFICVCFSVSMSLAVCVFVCLSLSECECAFMSPSFCVRVGEG